MTKKILLSLLFIVAFILILSASDKVSALTVKFKDTDICFDSYKLFEYNVVTYSESSDGSCEIVLWSLESPFILKTSNSGVFLPWSGLLTHIAYYYPEGRFYVVSQNKYSDVGGGLNLTNIIYLDYDLCDAEGNVVVADMTAPKIDEFFNFRHGTLDYSINLTGYNKEPINAIGLRDYISIFKVDNILLIHTSEDRPTYKYNNYKHYLCTKDVTATYGYDLKTDTVILDSTLTTFSKNGAEIAFDKSQLIYSNFVLYDEKTNLLWNPTGDYLGDEDMKRYCFRKYFSRWTNF